MTWLRGVAGHFLVVVASRRTRVGYTMVDRAGTKTYAGARVVDLDADTVATLKLWRKAQTAERDASGIDRRRLGLRVHRRVRAAATRRSLGESLRPDRAQLTLSIYSHVLPRQQSAAAVAFARLVDEPPCPVCGEPLHGSETDRDDRQEHR